MGRANTVNMNEDYTSGKTTGSVTERQESKNPKESLLQRLDRLKKEKQSYIDML